MRSAAPFRAATVSAPPPSQSAARDENSSPIIITQPVSQQQMILSLGAKGRWKKACAKTAVFTPIERTIPSQKVEEPGAAPLIQATQQKPEMRAAYPPTP